MVPTRKRLRRNSRSSLPMTAAIRVRSSLSAGLGVFADQLEVDVLERVAALADREHVGAGRDERARQLRRDRLGSVTVSTYTSARRRSASLHAGEPEELLGVGERAPWSNDERRWR